MTITAPTTRVEVGKAAVGDRAGVSAALAAAFHDDPVFAWIHPNRDDRAANLRSAVQVSVWYADWGTDLQECGMTRAALCY
jgi:hypothetical protein